MNRRRANTGRMPRGAQSTARPAGRGDFAAVLAKLDDVLMELHEHRRLIHRMSVVTETINLKEAARRLSRSTRQVKSYFAANIFTDGRAPENRVKGADLVFYADEIEVYRAEGKKGVERLRRELGRA